MIDRDFSGRWFTVPFRSALATVLGVFLLLCYSDLVASGASDAQPPLPTPEELFFRLSATVQRLRTVRMVAVDRFESHSLPNGEPTVGIRWHDLFLNGDHVQVRTVSQNEDRPDWREGKISSNIPLTKESLQEYEGNICCYRPEGEFTHADILNIPLSKKLLYNVLYAAYSTPRPVTEFALPFLAVGRAWNPPGSKTSRASLSTDSILAKDYQSWIDVKRDLTQKEPTISVTIPMTKEPASINLTKNKGVLKIWSVWNVWFTDDANYFPIRIEWTRRYYHNDQEIKFVPPSGGAIGPVFIDGKYKDYGNGLWYPESGSETRYALAPDKTAVSETPDDIVSEYLSKGQYRMKDSMFPTLIREWNVLILEDIPASSELWIEPPEGALVHKVDSHVEQIVGKTVEESNKILGQSGPGGTYRRPLVAPPSQSIIRMLFLWGNALLAVAVAVYCLIKWRKSA